MVQSKFLENPFHTVCPLGRFLGLSFIENSALEINIINRKLNDHLVTPMNIMNIKEIKKFDILETTVRWKDEIIAK